MENVTPELVGASTAILYMLISFLLGGGTVLLSVGLVARSILKSPVIIRFLEKLAEGGDPALIASLRDLVQLGNEITDGIPAEQKIVEMQRQAKLLGAIEMVAKDMQGQA